MRRIDYIVLHTTGASQTQSTADILKYWKNVKGWGDIPGYHLIIDADGKYERLAKDEDIVHGVEGHNKNAIHISWKGGWENKKAVDNRTNEQKTTLLTLVRTMRHRYPKAKIVGHNYFKGVNKACPSFDVKEWLSCVGINQ